MERGTTRPTSTLSNENGGLPQNYDFDLLNNNNKFFTRRKIISSLHASYEDGVEGMTGS